MRHWRQHPWTREPQCSPPSHGWLRRVPPVAAHSVDRLLSEPTAGTQLWRGEPLTHAPKLPYDANDTFPPHEPQIPRSLRTSGEPSRSPLCLTCCAKPPAILRRLSRVRLVDEGGQSMKIVVIGGTGLIGSKTVAILHQGGHEVVAASPKKRRQQHHRRGPQRGYGCCAGGDRPRQFALIRRQGGAGSSRPPAATFSRRRPQRTSGTMSRSPSSQSTGQTMAISAPRSPN